MGRGDPAERGVVVGAVVQARAAAVRGVDHPGDEGGAVGAEDRLRGLDLDLELQRTGHQPEAGLQPLRREHHRLDLVDRRHLGQRDDEALRQRAAVGERLQEQCQRPQAAAAGRALEALEADAVKGRRVTELDRLAQRRAPPARRRRPPCRRRDGVAVLEVDPQVLDRLAAQLLPHRVEQVEVVAEQVEEHRLVVVHRPPRPPAVLLEGAGVEAVGRNVDGVDRLPPGPLPRELPCQRRVGLLQSGVQLVGEPVQIDPRARTVRVGHAGTLGRSDARHPAYPALDAALA